MRFGVSLLTDLEEGRLAQYLGYGNFDLPVRLEIVARFPPEKTRHLLAQLGAAQPAAAAAIVEKLAAAEAAPGKHAGPDGVGAVLPADLAFLAELPTSAAAVALLARLPDDDRRKLLADLPSPCCVIASCWLRPSMSWVCLRCSQTIGPRTS
jgi:hypothetical protein